MSIYLIILLFILIFLCAAVKGGSDLLEYVDYPAYCKRVPHYGFYLPDFPDNIKAEIHHNVFMKIVKNPYRKNMIIDRSRAEIMTIFWFIKKYGPAEIILARVEKHTAATVKKYFPKIKFILVEDPAELILKKDFYAGKPIYMQTDYAYKPINFPNTYSAAKYNINATNKILNTLKPKCGVCVLRAFSADEMVDIPAGRIMVMPYSGMRVAPFFQIELSGNALPEEETVNLRDLFARINIFNICVRNINHSDKLREYKTFDQYLERETVPPELQLQFTVTAEILKKQMEVPRIETEIEQMAPNMKIFPFPEEKLPTEFKLEEKGGIYYFHLYLEEFYEQYFKGQKLAFYSDRATPLIKLLTFYGKVYVREISDVNLKKLRVWGDNIERVKAKSAIKTDRPVLEKPFYIKEGVDNLEKVLRLTAPKTVVDIWIYAGDFLESVIEVFHRIYPYSIINVVGAADYKPYVLEWEPSKKWQKLVQPGDLVVDFVYIK
jgi:hypothetical protein